MRTKIIIGFSALACAWLLPTVVRAQQPTSRVIPFNNVATTIPASTPGQTLTIQLWDAAATPPGTLLFSEAQTLDVDATGAISFVFGSQTVNGLDPANFPSGASLFLDVVDSTGASVLPTPPGRIPLTAVAFALSAPHDVPGNLTMVNSTATAGNILKDGVLFLHNFGTNNTFLGQNAGNLTMTGTANTASGTNALLNNTTGFNNTASGTFALLNNTTGVVNTASGFSALISNTTGSGNTASGANALFSNTTGGANTASGARALGNNTTGNSNTASGLSALISNTTGERNTASGVFALQFNTTGSGNTAIGFGAGVDVFGGNLTNATAIGLFANVNASNKIRLGNTNVTVLEAEVGLTVVSDKTQKESFRPVDGEEVLRKIGGLGLTSWNYIGHDPKQFRHYGPVAQEFFAAFGHDGVGTIGTETTINSADMEGILMIAVQALEKRTAELGALKAENADLKARIEKLERSIGSHALGTKAE